MSDNQIKNPKIGGVENAEIPKEHIRLPQLHFVAAMDWIDKLGEKAFCGYLKLFTLGDRKGKSLKDDSANIPKSLDLVRKDIGISSKTTFYDKVIKPLWNFGLIDLEEYEASTRKSQKPVNIIVYPYPNMEYERMVKPLEKLRDYETDYNSAAKIHAKKKPNKSTVQKMDGNEIGDNDENSPKSTVQKMDGGPYKKWTVDRTESVRNNLRSNSFTNALNSFTNEEEEEEIVPSILDNPSLKLLNELAIKVGFNDDVAMELVNYVNEKGIVNLNETVIMDSFAAVQKDIDNRKTIVDIAKWTAGKIERVAKQSKLNLPKSDKVVPIPKQPKNNYGRKTVREEVVPEYLSKDVKEMGPSDEAYDHLKTLFKNEKPYAAESELTVWMDEKYKEHGIAEMDYVSLEAAIVKAQKDALDAKWKAWKDSEKTVSN
ncbi:hypothetical protein ABKP09_19615 [Peribacillus frigoritolerans]|uniref:hypothetical protein n=1 Tax=Peribacillus frigoritolerans TaxID=450367 RepID=UPI0032B33B1F